MSDIIEDNRSHGVVATTVEVCPWRMSVCGGNIARFSMARQGNDCQLGINDIPNLGLIGVLERGYMYFLFLDIYVDVGGFYAVYILPKVLMCNMATCTPKCLSARAIGGTKPRNSAAGSPEDRWRVAFAPLKQYLRYSGTASAATVR